MRNSFQLISNTFQDKTVLWISRIFYFFVGKMAFPEIIEVQLKIDKELLGKQNSRAIVTGLAAASLINFTSTSYRVDIERSATNLCSLINHF